MNNNNKYRNEGEFCWKGVKASQKRSSKEVKGFGIVGRSGGLPLSVTPFPPLSGWRSRTTTQGRCIRWGTLTCVGTEYEYIILFRSVATETVSIGAPRTSNLAGVQSLLQLVVFSKVRKREIKAESAETTVDRQATWHSSFHRSDRSLVMRIVVVEIESSSLIIHSQLHTSACLALRQTSPPQSSSAIALFPLSAPDQTTPLSSPRIHPRDT